MLSTDLSTIWLVVAAFLSIFVVACLIWLVQLGQYCRSAVQYVEESNAKSVSLRRIADIELTCTELLDSYNALLSSHKKLRSRIGMRELREKKSNGADLTADDARAQSKAALRLECKQKGLLR